jgi:hypothetical protein
MGLGVLVSKVFRNSVVRLHAILILAAVILPGAIGQAHHSSASVAQASLARAADITFRAGKHAKLPPHISTLLGVTKEEEFPVMQSLVRTGNLVQGFDVSVADRNDIVLFVVDEGASDQNLYLTSPEGTLRRMVSVKGGVGHVVRITAKNTTAFKKERRFWLDRLASGATN